MIKQLILWYYFGIFFSEKCYVCEHAEEYPEPNHMFYLIHSRYYKPFCTDFQSLRKKHNFNTQKRLKKPMISCIIFTI